MVYVSNVISLVVVIVSVILKRMSLFPDEYFEFHDNISSVLCSVSFCFIAIVVSHLEVTELFTEEMTELLAVPNHKMHSCLEGKESVLESGRWMYI